MGARRIAAIALSGALVAGGAGAAVAAVTKNDEKKTEQSIIDDAASRLNVTPEKLREALAAAEDAQIDQAVKDGKLTQKQADAMKAAHAKSGRVLGPLGPGGPHLRKGFGPGGPGGPGMRHSLLDDVAGALGTTPAKLFAQLRAGKTIADVAKAGGKTLDDVRSAVKAAEKTRLDKAVAAGDLTQKQADAILARIDDKLKAVISDKPLRLRERGDRRDHGPRPPAGAVRPGGMLPGDEAPELAPPPDGVYY
jgi:uncharacterized protein (DUF433 family)